MTKAESKVASYLMDLAADKFHEHSCNDMSTEAFFDLTDEEKLALEQSLNVANSFGMDAEDCVWLPLDEICDDQWMRYFAERLEDEA